VPDSLLSKGDAELSDGLSSASVSYDVGPSDFDSSVLALMRSTPRYWVEREKAEDSFQGGTVAPRWGAEQTAAELKRARQAVVMQWGSHSGDADMDFNRVKWLRSRSVVENPGESIDSMDAIARLAYFEASDFAHSKAGRVGGGIAEAD
tara:strand:- start:95 stop:541 length:447 start_codon:yes stop_codon:yes gene_type:complete